MIKQFTSVLSAAILGGFVAVGSMYYLEQTEQTEIMAAPESYIQPTQAAYRNVASFEAVDFTNAAEETVHGVVHVKTLAKGQQYYEVNPLQYFFFGQAEAVPRQAPPQRGSGSGVVVSSEGYIVTNNHVIDGADEIEVVLNDNRSYQAEVIGSDPSTDIALLKVDADDLYPVPLGNSDDLKLGEWVLAVGNPYNLNSTVTAGIISAKGRSIDIMSRNRDQNFAPIESFIQTDAAVNPGNSGGALVNTKGELIGINTAIKSPTGTFTGYSFAVPSNIVHKVVEDLRDFGVVQRGFLGVSIRDVDSKLAEELDIDQPQGVYVNGLLDDGAAENAGIEKGDIIVGVGTNSVTNVPQLQEQIGRYRPGDEVTVTVLRDGEEKKVPLVLRNRFGNTEVIEKSVDISWSALGAEFNEINENVKTQLDIDYGVQVVELKDGKLKDAGLREGFIVLQVDKKPIRNPEQLANMLAQLEEGTLIEGIYPNGKRGYYGVGN